MLFCLVTICLTSQNPLEATPKTASDYKGYPTETAILNLSSDEQSNWKEISRQNGASLLVERIPINQTPENWSELIGIQYVDLRHLDENPTVHSKIEVVAATLKKMTLSSYPGKKVTWVTIEKNKNDIIYQWTLHEPYFDTPAQTEIAKGFFTKSGFHRIGFTSKKTELTADEKQLWIQLLKEATVVPFKKAINLSGMSLTKKS